MSILKRVFRAAVAQPWDYMGEGAPTEWEFRVSPNEEMIAVYRPDTGVWMFLDARLWYPVAEVDSLSEMDRNTADWPRYVEALEDE